MFGDDITVYSCHLKSAMTMWIYHCRYINLHIYQLLTGLNSPFKFLKLGKKCWSKIGDRTFWVVTVVFKIIAISASDAISRHIQIRCSINTNYAIQI